MYHYTECGLTNVWLANGYIVKNTQHGEAVAVIDTTGLHAVIAAHLINKPIKLTGKEIRFLRSELDLPQTDLAKLLGVAESTLRAWENNRSKITNPADKLLRVLYQSQSAHPHIKELINTLASINREINELKINLSLDNNKWVDNAA